MSICTHRKKVLLELACIIGLLLFQPCLKAQSSNNTKQSDEQIIRNMIERANKGERSLKYTDSIVIAFPALPYPQVGKQRTEQELKLWADIKKERSNEKLIRHILRIEIASSGDMAYEYGSYTVDYDNPAKQHVHNDGSYLHVWRKVNHEWLIEAIFNRYNQDNLKN